MCILCWYIGMHLKFYLWNLVTTSKSSWDRICNASSCEGSWTFAKFKAFDRSTRKCGIGARRYLVCVNIIYSTDATAKSKADVLAQSHIYCYDKAFNETTHEALMKALKKVDFKIFACFSNKQKLNKFGCNWIAPIHNLKVNTTGGQNFTIHFYKRVES